MRAIFVVLLLWFGPGLAQTTAGTMTITAAGDVQVVPDMATISLGLEVEAPTADRALRLNAVRMRQIIDVLINSGIKKQDIQTSQLTLLPLRDNSYLSDGQQLKITSFLTTNLVQVRVRKLDMLGATLDVLTKSGANRIQSIRLGVTRPGPYLDQARRLAVAEALRKAVIYAKAAKVDLGPILSITEGSTQDLPQLALDSYGGDSIPIAEGEMTLSASVTIQFSVR